MTTQRTNPELMATGARREAWISGYAAKLFVTDFIVIVWAVLGSQLI